MIYRFGEENVDTEIPITEPEVDVVVYNNPVSIKTKSGTSLSGVKLIWTVDSENAQYFQNNYKPSCDMIFVQINWNHTGGLFYFPKETKLECFDYLGRESYIKLPSKGTNPRGVEISTSAMKMLVNHSDSLKIDIEWKKEEIEFNAFKRWIEIWAQE